MADGNNETSADDSPDVPISETDREWKFTQWFRKMQNDGNGDGPTMEEANYITAVEFDESGTYLATGDRSGNVVVLQNDPEKAKEKGETIHYSFFSEFQSHHVEFDFVRSMQVEEKINQIKWGPKTNESLFLLATNDKQIKLWKVTEREPLHFVNFNFMSPGALTPMTPGGQSFGVDLPQLSMRQEIIKELKVPRIIREPLSTVTSLKKLYSPDAHQFHITSLAVAPDKSNFLSGDNLKINLWDFFRQDKSYNIVDATPYDMKELNEIVTTMDYHPSSPHLFIYGSNTGCIRLCDLRKKALVDEPSMRFLVHKKDRPQAAIINESGELEETQDQQSLFDEVTCGISAAKFSRGGRFIISRDYMSVKIWDMNYDKKPVETIYVHEYLREKLFELYQSELLWDNFGLGVSSRGDIVTGSYSNYFHMFDLGEKKDIFIQASKAPETISPLEFHNRKRNVMYNHPTNNTMSMKKRAGFNNFNFGRFFSGSKKKQQKEQKLPVDDYPLKIDFASIEFTKKVLDCAWHPESNVVAIAGQNNLFVYSK